MGDTTIWSNLHRSIDWWYLFLKIVYNNACAHIYTSLLQKKGPLTLNAFLGPPHSHTQHGDGKQFKSNRNTTNQCILMSSINWWYLSPKIKWNDACAPICTSPPQKKYGPLTLNAFLGPPHSHSTIQSLWSREVGNQLNNIKIPPIDASQWVLSIGGICYWKWNDITSMHTFISLLPEKTYGPLTSNGFLGPPHLHRHIWILRSTETQNNPHTPEIPPIDAVNRV